MENHLRRLLDELNEALGRTRPDDRAELDQLRSDVEDRLSNDDPERHGQLVDSLQDAESRLQADHPRLVQAIQQALRSLADAGL